MAIKIKSTPNKSTAIDPAKLNRATRRKLGHLLFSPEPGLSIVNPNAAGIDVGNGNHYVAVPPDRDPQHVRTFESHTADLNRIAEWLKQCRIDTIAMQATGVYWIALYDILCAHGLKVILVNAQYTKNVPGRKTDVQECQWLMKLHAYGLLRDSFHLPERMQRIRTLWRLRDGHVKEASQAVQHMQKALTTMNIQLANAISDISGVTGQAIIAAILKGERDPYTLAGFRDRHIRASREEVARSLEGNWRDDHLFALKQAVDSYPFAHKQMEECDKLLQSYMAALPTQPLATASEAAGPERQKNGKKKKSKKAKGNAPKLFDLRAELARIAGVDLASIDGIDVMTAQTIIAEIGTDLSQFPDEDHFASWLGLCPYKNVTGGKVVGRARRKVNSRVAVALRTAATTLRKSNSYLGSKYRHLQFNLASKKAAVKAMARYLAVLVYRLLTYGQAWVDRGAARFEQDREKREMAALTARAAAKGQKLVPIDAVN